MSSQEGPHSVSFAGCGFLATYQLGVAQGLLTQAPWILHAAPRVLGASSGSLVAAAVVCGVKIRKSDHLPPAAPQWWWLGCCDY